MRATSTWRRARSPPDSCRRPASVTDRIIFSRAARGRRWIRIRPTAPRFGVRVANVADARDAALWAAVRHGTFGYRIPLPDGRYRVRLGFLEPDRNAPPGARRFRVDAGGTTRIADLDIVAAAGAPATAIERAFDVEVTDGSLRLDFVPATGEAVLSNLAIERL
ncbi:malectin domain-containing carbohydrate-binding protein [Telluria antibiotica]|uniref:malectin domain-containing carbohydrate-binding protein n=1 Tax=Telluria antibiotica TaxID=2717319 RepID=UPI003530902A